MVIVSHLGEDLRKESPFSRIDGIEAKGLDEDLNLIVDRQPVFGKPGRSTPKLIVERLARTRRGGEGKIFERILKAFRNGQTNVLPASPSEYPPVEGSVCEGFEAHDYPCRYDAESFELEPRKADPPNADGGILSPKPRM